MIVTDVNTGPKAGYSVSGTDLTVSVPNVGDIVLDLQAKQGQVQESVDISLDRSYSRLVEGIGSWYVASIEVPPAETELYDTGEVDENGDPVMAERDLPLDMAKVKLRLWGLPESISSLNTNDEEVI